MAKKIIIKGRAFSSKLLCRIGLKRGKAVLIKCKERTLYNHGIVVIVMSDGTLWTISSDTVEGTWSFFYYDTNGSLDEFIFTNDQGLNEGWSKVFIFLFDEDEALLIYADRDALGKVGAYAAVGKGYNDAYIKQQAYNIASLFSKEALKNIIQMEAESQEETDMLEERWLDAE